MSAKYCVDANVFLTAWYTTYPPRILRPLWEKIAEKNDFIEIIKPVYDEIEPIRQQDKKLNTESLRSQYPLRVWIDETAFPIIDVGEDVNNLSIKLEMEYETAPESKGAGQVDITLIAYSKINSMIVVTLEAEQPQKPEKISNYKIPLICKEENVDCINFVRMLDLLKVQV